MKTGTHADTGGLYIRVRDTGKKSWVKREYKDGVATWKKMGEYPSMTLAEARRAVNGEDISISEAIKGYMSKISVRRPEQVEALLEPLHEFRSIHTPKAALIAELQKKAKTAPVLANRMLTRWKDFFNYAEQQGWITTNPIFTVQRKFVGGKEISSTRVLSWVELAHLFRFLPFMRPDTALALYMILATGLRSTEALWVMRNKKLDNIPTKENPNPPTQHKIPKVPHLRALLRLKYKVPASNDTLANSLMRLFDAKDDGRGEGIPGVERFTPHDLRRTFATRMADLGVALHVIEKNLDHKMQGMLAIYNHAEYFPERTESMKLWGRKLSELRRKARLLPNPRAQLRLI